MKDKSKLLMIMVLAVLVSITAIGQSRRTLTLSEAIDLSIKNNKNLKSSQAKIEEATAAVESALNRRLPDASVSGSYLRLNSANIDIKSKSSSAGSSGSAGTTAPADGGSPKVNQAVYGIANVTMPLYAGGRISYGIESAKYLEEAAKLDADNQKEDVIQNTINAYANLFKSRAALDIVKENLEAQRQRVAQFSNLEKNGLLARNDLLRAQLQASNVELSLLDAENNWRLSNINMNLMLGLPENTELAADSASLQQTTAVKSVDEYEQLAIQSRKDVAALELRKKAAATGVKAAKGEAYPSLALTGGYIAASIPNVLTITNAVNVGLGVQYNIASLWKTKSNIHEAEARQKQVAISQDILTDAIRLQINQAYQNYFSAQKKIDVYQTAVAQAAENFRITKNKYENALVTTTDLLDADVAQLQARLNLSNAKVDAVVAYNRLLQTAGLLNK
jgi:outer membrane protein